jgi:hypothetical protein
MATLTSFAKYVRPYVPGCPEPILLDAIKDACVEFCKRTLIFTRDIEIVTVIGQRAYAPSLAAEEAPEQIEMIERDTYALDDSSFHEFKGDITLRSAGTPTKYYLDENGDIVLGPIPDAIETLAATVAIKPAEDATTVPDALLSHWSEYIAAGAKAALFGQENVEWGDPTKAASNGMAFDEGVNKALMKRARGGTRKRLRTVSQWM